MNGSRAKRGFTLIELLVASLLMGMLVTILTMVFNSSSVAWRTGKAGIAEMNKMRRQVSYWEKTADDSMPRVNKVNQQEMGLVVSAWSFRYGNDRSGLRKRSVLAQGSTDKATTAEKERYQKANSQFTQIKSNVDSSRRPWQMIAGVQGSSLDGGQSSYTVGVRSWGPDGKENTEDDISSWPEDMK